MGQIVVPPLSESVVEATVSEWTKKTGDSVAVGDVLVILETDKVTLEVTAEESGTLGEILAPEGTDVVAGQALGSLTAGAAAPAKAEAAPAKAEEKAPAKVEEKAAPAAVVVDAGVKSATPVAQRMAKEHGIDLGQIPSNGGKIDK